MAQSRDQKYVPTLDLSVNMELYAPEAVVKSLEGYRERKRLHQGLEYVEFKSDKYSVTLMFRL